MDHPYPWLKYLPADDCPDGEFDFDGLDVESAEGEHLGDVEGFIVDSDSGRPYYVVVDSGGWFKSKHFLLPVGHANLETEREVLVADLTRERVEQFPGFDIDAFAKLTADDLQRMNHDTLRACGLADLASPSPVTATFSADWDRPDYRYPDWWRGASPHSTGTNRAMDQMEEK
jgi:hypothetical protein